MKLILILVLVVAVAVLVGLVVGLNRLRASNVRVDEALAGIDVQLTRRASLIPSLVHVVETFAAHERSVIEHVTQARAALTTATSGTSVTQRSDAQRQLDSAVDEVIALGRTNPQLTSSANYLDLQKNLSDTEDKLAFARQYYNDAVSTLNRELQTIPWMYVAGIAGISQRDYYRTQQ